MARVILRLDADLLGRLAPLRERGVRVAPLCRRLLRSWLDREGGQILAEIIAREAGR